MAPLTSRKLACSDTYSGSSVPSKRGPHKPTLKKVILKLAPPPSLAKIGKSGSAMRLILERRQLNTSTPNAPFTTTATLETCSNLNPSCDATVTPISLLVSDTATDGPPSVINHPDIKTSPSTNAPISPPQGPSVGVTAVQRSPSPSSAAILRKRPLSSDDDAGPPPKRSQFLVVSSPRVNLAAHVRNIETRAITSRRAQNRKAVMANLNRAPACPVLRTPTPPNPEPACSPPQTPRPQYPLPSKVLTPQSFQLSPPSGENGNSSTEQDSNPSPLPVQRTDIIDDCDVFDPPNSCLVQQSSNRDADNVINDNDILLLHNLPTVAAQDSATSLSVLQSSSSNVDSVNDGSDVLPLTPPTMHSNASPLPQSLSTLQIDIGSPILCSDAGDGEDGYKDEGKGGHDTMLEEDLDDEDQAEYDKVAKIGGKGGGEDIDQSREGTSQHAGRISQPDSSSPQVGPLVTDLCCVAQEAVIVQTEAHTGPQPLSLPDQDMAMELAEDTSAEAIDQDVTMAPAQDAIEPQSTNSSVNKTMPQIRSTVRKQKGKAKEVFTRQRHAHNGDLSDSDSSSEDTDSEVPSNTKDTRPRSGGQMFSRKQINWVEVSDESDESDERDEDEDGADDEADKHSLDGVFSDDLLVSCFYSCIVSCTDHSIFNHNRQLLLKR